MKSRPYGSSTKFEFSKVNTSNSFALIWYLDNKLILVTVFEDKPISKTKILAAEQKSISKTKILMPASKCLWSYFWVISTHSSKDNYSESITCNIQNLILILQDCTTYCLYQAAVNQELF